MQVIGFFGVIMAVSALVLGAILIPFLRRLKAGQSIRQEGPQSHLKKAGTPTMGGLIFVLPWVVGSFFLLGPSSEWQILATSTLGFGAIGLIDDYIKVVLKRNLGLRAYQKIIGQLVVAALVLLMLGLEETDTLIPIWNHTLDLGWFYYLFVFFFVVAVTNSVNLTDGLDGLASSVSIVFLFFMIAIAVKLDAVEVAANNWLFATAILGFLFYNRHPAKVFMGDFGSLAIGGYIAAMMLILKVPLLFLVIGLIFLMEAVSVVVQVFWFKRTGKRFFKMAPIHHHFELSGLKEVQVVTLFITISIVVGVIAYGMML